MFVLEAIAWAVGILVLTWVLHGLFPISRETLEGIPHSGGGGAP